MSEDTQQEIRTTRYWGSVILGAVLVPTVLGFIWVGSIDNRVDRNEKDIAELGMEIRSVESDIRDILVGIEQVKARLGIVEQE